MRVFNAWSLSLILCGALSAQEAAAPKKEEAAAAEKAVSAPPPQAPAEVKPEPKAAPEIKEETKPAAKLEPPAKAEEPKPAGGPEGELSYLRWAADQDSSEARDAVIEDLEGFITRHREDEWGQQAQLILSDTFEKKGDHYEAVLEAAKFLYEYPDSKLSFQAKRSYADLVEKRMGRKIKAGLNDLANVPSVADKAQRLALLLHGIVDRAGDYFREPLEEEFAAFFTRFPDYPQGDQVLLDWALMRTKNSKYDAAVLPYKKLLAVYPQSPFRAQAQWEIGSLYAEHVKDYNKAIDAFQELVQRYPKDSRVEPALEKTAQLFEDKLKHYDMAFDVDEKIIKLFPTTIGALHALQDQAHLQRDKLDKSMDAINTCKRLTVMYHNSSGVEALQLAAKIARKDLKNYTLEIELRKQLASEFADFQEAPEQLFAAAEVYEDDLGDLDNASKTYSEVAAKFPTHKLAGKAQGRIERIQKKKAK